jgi:MoCo/4Fe-4S cofactor protein with predicted Tat translocation signal
MNTTDETHGREFWRSLDELADDPVFQERLHHEFPTAVEAITDPVERRMLGFGEQWNRKYG